MSSLARVAMMLASTLISGQPAARAEQSNPATQASTSDAAEQLRAKARDLRRAAGSRRSTEEADCQRRFLVDRCLREARDRYRHASGEAERLEREAQRLEREGDPRAAEPNEGRAVTAPSPHYPDAAKLKAVAAQRDRHLRQLQREREHAESTAPEGARDEAGNVRRQPVVQPGK